MKSAKHPSATTKKLSTAPELPYKKGLINSLLSPKPKEKPIAKSVHDRVEPMVLRSPPMGESIMRYALPIPSSNAKELLASEIVRKVATHLQMVVSTLEEVYGAVTEDGEVVVAAEEQDLSLSLGNDINSFLVCCSQFAIQLEESANEEYKILESLFKWFQQQVNQMEEISKDNTLLEDDLPTPDKNITLSIALIVKLVDKFKELRGHIKQRRKESMLPRPMDKDNRPVAVKSYDAIQKKIEEFISTHSTEDYENILDNAPKTPYSLSSQLDVMIKIFESQTNMLERALNDQKMLEAKYKQMENDFELLPEEQSTLENEVQKLKDDETTKPTSKDDHTRQSVKIETKKEDLHGKKSATGELITSAEFLQLQKEVDTLKMEKKDLQEQLKLALQVSTSPNQRSVDERS